MLSTKTLISLACILSNKGDLNTNSLEAQLTSEERTKLSKVIEAGACLPPDVDILIEKTKIRIQSGEINNPQGSTNPTREC